MFTTGAVGASSSKQRKRKRNAPRSRRDPGWEYAIDVEGDSRKTKCKFCSKEIMSSFNTGHPGSNNLPPASSQSIMSKILKKDLRKDACRSIARWFCLTGTTFNTAREPEYYTMFELAARDAHCLDLMLEDLEKNLPIHKTTISKGRKITNFIYGRSMLISILNDFTKGQDLIRPTVTRFATAYLTLGCLTQHKGDLMNDRPTMPFLYLELNEAIQKIKKKNFYNVDKRYKHILNIIEKRWTNQMSRHLHYAAYWLNPKVHFSQGFNDSKKTLKVGLYDCVERFAKTSEERLTIMEHLDAFHHGKGSF
ncbi:hypothetical protein LINGRAHAP2_LOCUS14852 [Linum grandiflorum]